MSIFLAKAFCLYFIVVGLALLFNCRTMPGVYDEFFKNRAALTLSGIITLVLGILLILVHNIWMIGWPLIITILSWWAFIKGSSILLFPDQMIAFSKRFTRENSLRIAGICMTLFGLIMGYFGFISI